MSEAVLEPASRPAATAEQVRTRASELIDLAAGYGITDLAFASAGRLRGHVSDHADPFAPFSFQLAATELLGAEVELLSDGALASANVSPDLLAASPL